MSSKWPFNKRWTIFALELLFFVALYFGLKAYMQKDMVRGEVPMLAATTLQGDAIDLQALRGQPLLVHFWATWCGICKFEESSIQNISEDYTTITIAMQSGTAEAVQAHLLKNQRTFTVINDEEGEIAQRFGVSGVPASFIVDAQGQIRFLERGYTSEWGLRSRLWWIK